MNNPINILFLHNLKNQQSVEIGQRNGFSAKDIEKVNKMYRCKKTTTSTGYKPNITQTSNTWIHGITDFMNMIMP